jgi:hypothetical protein
LGSTDRRETSHGIEARVAARAERRASREVASALGRDFAGRHVGRHFTRARREPARERLREDAVHGARSRCVDRLMRTQPGHDRREVFVRHVAYRKQHDRQQPAITPDAVADHPRYLRVRHTADATRVRCQVRGRVRAERTGRDAVPAHQRRVELHFVVFQAFAGGVARRAVRDRVRDVLAARNRFRVGGRLDLRQRRIWMIEAPRRLDPANRAGPRQKQDCDERTGPLEYALHHGGSYLYGTRCRDAKYALLRRRGAIMRLGAGAASAGVRDQPDHPEVDH